MNNTNDFILSSDYATLANDSVLTSLSLTVPAGTTVPAASGGVASVTTFQSVLTIGEVNASIRAIARDVTTGSDWVVGSQLITDLFIWANISGFPDPSPLTFSYILERISPTQMRVYIDIVNFYSTTMFIRRDSTVQFQFNTFLTPFL